MNTTFQHKTGTSWLARLSLIAMCVILTGCAGGFTQGLQRSLTALTPANIDFAELQYYAERSSSAYDAANDIRNDYPLATRVTTVQPADVRYFVETDHSQRTQTISVRGTAEKPNIWQDIETALIPDSILGISLHRGFQADAQAILTDVRPHLRDDYGVRITGHSLGGAVAAILGLYLDKEGFRVERVVTFGEPRFTTETPDSAALRTALRVVHNRDVVPLLPPHSAFGNYKHASSEVILRPGAEYVYLDEHDADRLSVGEFWRSITSFSFADHHMDGYLSNIQQKVEQGAVQVPYLGGSQGQVTVQN